MATSVRGDKFNSGKPRMSLMPGISLRAVAMVYNYGEKKYAAWNWAKGLSFTELIDATERHISYFKDGENLDRESNLHHLAHAVFGLLCILYFMSAGRYDLDDRFIRDRKGFGRNFMTKMNEPPIKLQDMEASNDTH